MIKNNNVLLVIGMISLALALLLKRFGPELSIVDFMEGLFIGLSLTTNLFYLVRYRKQKDNSQLPS